MTLRLMSSAFFAGMFLAKYPSFNQKPTDDSARFKKEHADLAAAYTKTTTTRRFSVR